MRTRRARRKRRVNQILRMELQPGGACGATYGAANETARTAPSVVTLGVAIASSATWSVSRTGLTAGRVGFDWIVQQLCCGAADRVAHSDGGQHAIAASALAAAIQIAAEFSTQRTANTTTTVRTYLRGRTLLALLYIEIRLARSRQRCGDEHHSTFAPGGRQQPEGFQALTCPVRGKL